MAGNSMTLYFLVCLILMAGAKGSQEEEDKSETLENDIPKGSSFLGGTKDMFRNVKEKTMTFFYKKKSQGLIVIDVVKSKVQDGAEKASKTATDIKDRAEYAMRMANEIAGGLKEKAKDAGLNQVDKVKKLKTEAVEKIDEKKKHLVTSVTEMKDESHKKLNEAIDAAKKKASDVTGKVASGLFIAGEKTALMHEKLQDKAE